MEVGMPSFGSPGGVLAASNPFNSLTPTAPPGAITTFAETLLSWAIWGGMLVCAFGLVGTGIFYAVQHRRAEGNAHQWANRGLVGCIIGLFVLGGIQLIMSTVLKIA